MDFHARTWFETLVRRWVKCPTCGWPPRWKIVDDAAVCDKCAVRIAVGDDAAEYKSE